MAIRIKRSSGNTAPSVLDSGQLAYVEGSTNGGTLYIGEIGGTVREIAGKKFVDKVNGIEAGAQVNTVTSVFGRTGSVTLQSSDVTTALTFTPENSSNKGQANGYASLDSGGKVPSTQLPSYVDDVLEAASFNDLPETGASGIIYVTLNTNKTYRWGGSSYVEISASPGSTDSVTEGSTNLYYTDSRARSAISVTDSGGDGSLSYNSSTGVITFTGPSAAEVRAHISAGTGISITDGVITNTVTDTNTTYTVSAETATGGAYVRLTGSDSATDDVAIVGSGSVTVTRTDANTITIDGTDVGLEDIIEDTTPQLGGDLDVNGKKIVTVSNGSVIVAPNGTGSIILNESGTGIVIARRTSGAGTTNNGMFVQRNYTADVLANMDGHSVGLVFSQRDSTGAQAFYTRLAGEYLTDGSHTHWFEKSTNNGTNWTRQATLGDNEFIMGALTGTTTQNIGTYGVQNLVLGTNASNDGVGGIIYVEAGTNGGIELTPHGTGAVTIDGLNWPTADGSANQVLKTDGAGNLSWVTQTAGVTAFTGLSDVPSSYTGTGGYYVKVNSGATALEFSQHVDDGTF